MGKLFFGLMFVMLTAACAHAGLFDDDDARKAINTLNTQQKADKAANEAQFARIDANVKAIENSVKSLGLVELVAQIDALKTEIKSLRGQQEVLNNSIEITQKKQRDFYLDLDSRIKRLEETPQPAPVSSLPPATVTSSVPVITSSPTTVITSSPAPVVSAPPVNTVPQPPAMPGTKKK
ncbi:MAG: YbgF trimerization domain-containing protein [Burkholderiales bacterium]